MDIFEKVGYRADEPAKRPVSMARPQIGHRQSIFARDRWLDPISPLQVPSDYGSIGGGADDLYQYELMLRHIYKRARGNGWFTEEDEIDHVKVALRTAAATEDPGATYLTAPHVEQDESDRFVTLLDLAGFLHCEVIIAVSSKVTSVLLQSLPPTIKKVSLGSSTNIQVIDTFEEFMSIRPNQYATFVREYDTLLIWSGEVNNILELGKDLEQKMVNMIWDEKHNLERGIVPYTDEDNLEVGFFDESKRTVSNIIPILVAISYMAIAVFIGKDLHEVVLQIKADGNWAAIAIVLYFPLMMWLASFFAQTFAVTVWQMFGPVSQLTTNSKYYSGIPPDRREEIELPHVTIQCPVYKEDLEGVLEPAIRSVRDAVKTYEMQGGTANIFVNDDGMHAISPADRKKRVAFYKQNNIGWVARPPDGLGDFVRAGKFKKASNMNYCLNIAYKLEQILSLVDRTGDWSDTQESRVTEKCLNKLLLEQNPPALGAGDIRIGDLILLIDADTRIPSDCFLDAAYEFHNSPEVAILQHTSVAFQVVHNYWEDCMAYFTLFVSEAMRFMTAGGDVCPFIGHNAFLRWSAVQEVTIESEGQYRWWSETHVSEDFELSMKLQYLGYCVRMAAYSDGDFKEGVSLTVYDEIARWQKYAYGISELCFNPLRYWPTRGPLSKLFRQFLTSNKIAGSSKFLMVAYMGSYYAIGSAWLLSFVNYFVLGWASVTTTKLYQNAFQILIATLVVFDVAVPVINALYQYRTRRSGFFVALLQNFRWILLLCIFFGGLSLHITQSLVWHLLGIPLHWDSTAKSLESSYFLKEIPMIWRRYKFLYIFIILTSTLTIVLATSAVPQTWKITPQVVTGLPIGWVLGCHAVAPLILNPQSWLSELHL